MSFDGQKLAEWFRSRGLYVALIGVIAFAAASYAKYWSANANYRVAMEGRVYPTILSGGTLSFTGSQLIRGETLSDSLPQVVLAIEDECGACRSQRPDWLDLLSKMEGRPVGLTVLFFGTDLDSVAEIARSASEHRIPIRVRHVTDKLGYTLRTGVVSVPMTLVVDRNSMIRAVVHRVNSVTLPELLRQLDKVSTQ